jgi:hypothetical protein
MRNRLLWVVAVTVVAAQLLPHPPNVTPVRAAALFGGAVFASRWQAFAVPLGSFLLGSIAVGAFTGNWSYGFHALAPVVYASFALSACLGLALRRRRRLAPIAAATLAGSLLFFLVTNLAVWWFLGGFPHTAQGLAACYTAGLPYLASGSLGDIGYAALLFGGLALVERARASASAGSAA